MEKNGEDTRIRAQDVLKQANYLYPAEQHTIAVSTWTGFYTM
jgi:hypothetical protein